jgi:hypothetical protein
MRAFLAACFALVVIGAGGYFFLGFVQEPSGVAYTTDGTRISPNWAWRSVGATGECDPRKSWQWFFVDFGRPSGEPSICKISQ